MKTPITDKALERTQGLFRASSAANGFTDTVRLLELDRAALMGALQMMFDCELMGGDQRQGLGPDKPGTSPVAKARAALSAARANFPDQP